MLVTRWYFYVYDIVFCLKEVYINYIQELYIVSTNSEKIKPCYASNKSKVGPWVDHDRNIYKRLHNNYYM